MAAECPDAQELAGSIGDALSNRPFVPNPSLAQAAVRYLLATIGEDVNRAGLLDTPKRVVKALQEMTSGTLVDTTKVLGTMFDETSDEMILVRGIRYVSLCEHHLLPFIGTATLAYIPKAKVVGLSKLPRLVEAFSRRPQMQERLTQQVARQMWDSLNPLGVGVVMQAKHSCMGCRGVRQPDADMVTSCLLGNFRESGVRQEFFALASIEKN